MTLTTKLVWVQVTSTGNFKGRTTAGVAKKVANAALVPVLEKEEADKVDEAVYSYYLVLLKNRWDSKAIGGVPKFASLPSGWQTAMFSRLYKKGAIFFSDPFFDQACKGEWENAVTVFEGYTFGRIRVDAEARLLRAEMPIAVGRAPAAARR